MNKHFIKAAVGAMALLAGTHVLAYDFTSATLQSLGQSKFKLLGEDVSSTLTYKAMIPAADLGITGFDVGVSLGGTKIANRDAMKEAAGGASVPSILPSVALRVHKGLPFNLNVGASYTNVPGTPLSALGGELRWAVLPGGALMPAVSARISASSSMGVDQLKLKSTGFDVSVSKGFTLLTPYLGIGRVQSKVSAPQTTLATEKIGQTKYFGGVNANLGLMNLAIEGDRTGKASTYSLKLGMRF